MSLMFMGLLSTPDGNKYFHENKDYLDYIEKKCGYEVYRYVSSIFEVVESLDNDFPDLENVACDVQAMLDDLNYKEIYPEEYSQNPILKLKRLTKEVSEATDLLERTLNVLNKCIELI